MEDDLSFLSHFRHRTIARLLVVDRLLVKIPKEQFALVKELYDPLRAALDGTLVGSGTLPMVMLCETLLSYLPTGTGLFQPHRLLKGYDQISQMTDENRLDLRSHATVRNGMLYVEWGVVERVWVPLGHLSPSSRATAKKLLDFLGELRNVTPEAAARKAAELIVLQFRNDLFDMGIVDNVKILDGDVHDGTIVETMTVEQYVKKVFRLDALPDDMASKGILKMALDLLNNEDLTKQLALKLNEIVKTVPKTTTHARTLTFSSTRYTLLLKGELSKLTTDDAQRLVVAAQPLLRHYFNMTKTEVKRVIKNRATLTRAVRSAVSASKKWSLNYETSASTHVHNISNAGL